jgi:hypothetical protein
VAWLIGDDFNAVRTGLERKGNTFNHTISAKFNNFINTNVLIDLKSTDRLFTWSNLRYFPSCACLDRFLFFISWGREFPHCISKSLPKYQSCHNALILITNTYTNNQHNHIIRWDKTCPSIEGFSDLLISWWYYHTLNKNDIGNSW